jgi:hypothetical protein
LLDHLIDLVFLFLFFFGFFCCSIQLVPILGEKENWNQKQQNK